MGLDARSRPGQCSTPCHTLHRGKEANGWSWLCCEAQCDMREDACMRSCTGVAVAVNTSAWEHRSPRAHQTLASRQTNGHFTAHCQGHAAPCGTQVVPLRPQTSYTRLSPQENATTNEACRRYPNNQIGSGAPSRESVERPMKLSLRCRVDRRASARQCRKRCGYKKTRG
jgi:hypothetical protein